MNELELKLKLAKKLPDLIDVVEDENSKSQLFYWKDRKPFPITDKEWDWVVSEVMNRFNKENGNFFPVSWINNAHWYFTIVDSEYKENYEEKTEEAFLDAFEKILNQ